MMGYLITPTTKAEEKKLLAFLSGKDLEAMELSAAQLQDLGMVAAIKAGMKSKVVSLSEVRQALKPDERAG